MPDEPNLITMLLSDEFVSGCETPGRPYLLGTNREKGRAALIQPDCGLWSCPHCATKNALRWTARAAHGADELMSAGEKVGMLTLTHNGSISPAKSLYRWRKNWPKLSARMRRKCPGFQYMYVHERHKSGVQHVHVLLTGDNFTERWFKDNGVQSGFGYMNDYELCRDRLAAAGYVSKYLAKQLYENEWPAGWRRIGTSRNWPKLPPPEKADGWEWLVCKNSIEIRCEIESVHMQGYTISVVSGCEFIQQLMGDTGVRLLYEDVDN